MLSELQLGLLVHLLFRLLAAAATFAVASSVFVSWFGHPGVLNLDPDH